MYLRKILPVTVSFLVLLVKSNELIHRCPSPEEIFPCTCVHNKWWNTVDVECKEINQDQLENVNANLANHLIDTYYIHNAKLKEIVKRVFRNVAAKKLRIFDSEVEVFDLFNGIHGMQKTLEELNVNNVDVQYWVTAPGDKFVNLKIFKFNNCPENLRNESRIIPYLPKTLIEVNFHHCTITSIEQFTFKEFTKLQQVILSSNGLTSVKRSYLPQPALHVSFYSLSDNPITALPDDMFLDMPALRTVWLQSTLLNILPYHVFKPILNHLHAMQIWDTPLNCSCETTWLLKEKSIWEISGANCKYPSKLEGRELDSLTKDDMCESIGTTTSQNPFTTVI